MKYIFVADNDDYISDLIWQMRRVKNVEILSAENPRIKAINQNDKFYIPSDTVYPLIRSFVDKSIKKIIDNFRNKYEFRKTLSGLFPDFIFSKTNLSELKNYIFNDNNKYIVKPISGFMGAGARMISINTDLQTISIEIEEELKKFSGMYPNIFSNELIIEEYIKGRNEYAVDMYYNEDGNPVIINIYCHPAAKRKEYLQMLYYTNKKIFEDFYEQIISFFKKLNKIIHATSFPIHAEFKLDKKRHLIPVEFNTCRFGGMGLTDLTYYAFKFHPIKAFFDDFEPDWASLWQKYQKETFCWVLGYNGANLDTNKYHPDHNKFKDFLPKSSSLLAYKKLDYTKSPGFALAYLSTINNKDIENILNIEFRDCFIH